jgi:hypothetical protein
MKKLLLFAALAASAHAQYLYPIFKQSVVLTAPSGQCSYNGEMQVLYSTGQAYFCMAGLWVAGAGGGGGGNPGGLNGQIQVNLAGSFGGVSTTGTGNVVLASGATLTNPNLGTPSTLVLTNATGLPLSTGVTGTLANNFLANSSTTVNGTQCTLGATCSVTSAAAGSTTQIQYNLSGVLAGAAATLDSGGDGSFLSLLTGLSGNTTGQIQVYSFNAGTQSGIITLTTGNSATTKTIGLPSAGSTTADVMTQNGGGYTYADTGAVNTVTFTAENPNSAAGSHYCFVPNHAATGPATLNDGVTTHPIHTFSTGALVGGEYGLKTVCVTSDGTNWDLDSPANAVLGPASSTSTDCAAFSGTSGAQLADSGAPCNTGPASQPALSTNSAGALQAATIANSPLGRFFRGNVANSVVVYAGDSTVWNATSWYEQMFYSNILPGAVFGGVTVRSDLTTGSSNGTSVVVNFTNPVPSNWALGTFVSYEASSSMSNCVGSGPITAISTNSITFTRPGSTSCTTYSLGSITGYVTSQIMNFGNNGETLAGFLADNTATGTNIGGVCAVQPALLLFRMGINDVRQGATTATAYQALLQTLINDIHACSPNTVTVLKVQNSLMQNDPTGTGLVTAVATTTTGSVSSTGSQTVGLAIMPDSLYVGGQFTIDSGGPQETVTITAISGLNVTATFANTHSSGVAAVATLASTAQAYSAILEAGVLPFSNLYPDVVVLDEQSTLYGTTAPAPINFTCTTNSTATCTTASTANLSVGQLVSGSGIPVQTTISSFVLNTSVTMSASATTSVSNNALVATSTYMANQIHPGTVGQTAEANQDIRFLSQYQIQPPAQTYGPVAPSTVSQMPFSAYLAQNARSQNYSTPWTIYPHACADPAYNTLIYSGYSSIAESAGGTVVTVVGSTGTTNLAVQNLDVVEQQSVGCWQIPYGANNVFTSALTGTALQITLSNSNVLPYAIASQELINIWRPKYMNLAAEQYINNPTTYPYRHRVIVTSTGTNFMTFTFPPSEIINAYESAIVSTDSLVLNNSGVVALSVCSSFG